MQGNISEIRNGYGFIYGSDRNDYFFHKNDLTNCTIFSLEEGDSVEFTPTTDEEGRLQAENVRRTSSSSQVQSQVNAGINPHVNLEKFNAEERRIISFFGKVFYVTNGGSTLTVGSSTYSYIIVKPTTEYSYLFNIKREIVVVFSDYAPFEPRSLDAAGTVYKMLSTKLRFDRSCHILISRDNDIENHLSEVLKDQNVDSIVIPFSYPELLDASANAQFVEERFRKYLFDADLFATSMPIPGDVFFFGRRDFVLDIAAKCKKGEHCGVFGLRRSGKTSVLLAVGRQLENEGYKTVFLPCQSELRQLNWKSALHRIMEKAKEATGSKNIRTHTEDDYKKNRASNYFAEDMRALLADLSEPMVLMFDEIESITFDVIDSGAAWQSGESYVEFWNSLRGFCTDNTGKLSIIVAGTNPMINEEPTIPSTGATNPMFNQLSSTNQGAYLPPFNVENTKIMIDTLGGYMGMKFNDSIPAALTDDCGGHPYLIRILCSEINKLIKSRNLSRPATVTKALYQEARSSFEKGKDSEDFFLMVLNILQTNYEKEFRTLKILATEGDRIVSQITEDHALSHLIGYGLIDNANGEYSIRFETIRRFLQGKFKFERKGLSIEDQKQEINLRFGAGEKGLRNLIKNTLRTNLGASGAIAAVIEAMRNNKFASQFADEAQWLNYNQLFDVTVNKGMVFSVLIQIINDNFELFSNIFEGESLQTVKQHLYVLNRSRIPDSHNADDNAEGWTEEKFEDFRTSMTWLEEILKNFE